LIVFTNIAKEKKIVIFISSISLSGHSTLFPGLNTFHHRCCAAVTINSDSKSKLLSSVAFETAKEQWRHWCLK